MSKQRSYFTPRQEVLGRCAQSSWCNMYYHWPNPQNGALAQTEDVLGLDLAKCDGFKANCTLLLF